MKKTIIASAISLAFTSPIVAAENINLDDVVVTASRTQQAHTNVVGDVTVIGREEIERAGASSITDLLQSQPGVQISTNGGAGKTSSIYLRGTNADHLIVLVDGLRINSATSGTTAFENIPLAQIERIEILRGPASSLYGSDAIGGVIQIFTRKSETDKPLIHAAIGFGGYNTTTAEAGIGGGFGETRYGININSFNTDGFSAKRNGVVFDKDNDAYRNLGLTANINHNFNENNEIGAQLLQSEGDSDYDCYSKTTKGVVTKDGRVCEIKQMLRSYGIYSRNQLTPVWKNTLKIGMGTDNSEDFSGRSKTGAVSYSEYRTEQRQLTWQHDLSLPVGMLTLAYDRLEQKIDSTTLYKKDTRNNNGYLASYLANIGNHALQLSIRKDNNSQFGNYTTGGVGYGYRITPKWRVTANYGKAFKAPTFNQLYFPGFGNPNVQAEKSKNIEASVRYETFKFHIGTTLFDNKIDNLIAFAPTPVNINKAEILGATFDGRWNITDNLVLNGNITAQSPRDDQTDHLLARRGNRYGAVNLLHKWGELQWGAEITGASTRYNDPANIKKISGYSLVNLTANYKLTPEWKLETRANNILDKNYVLAYTGNSPSSVPYNTAGSNLFVGLRYDMKP
ncbi:MAG: TonB-dependent receptor [Methylotenera sp.]|nr:TonB-dependent receptor [Methylotenera sp.]